MMLLDSQMIEHHAIPAMPRTVAGSLKARPSSDHFWVRGNLVINLDSREVIYRDIVVNGLTKTEYQILLTLAERPGYVFTRAALEKLLYNEISMVGPRTVAVHISNLRSKLPTPGLIKTIYGVGYKLMTNV
jgi:DNA-binding response OmpR family regulator